MTINRSKLQAAVHAGYQHSTNLIHDFQHALHVILGFVCQHFSALTFFSAPNNESAKQKNFYQSQKDQLHPLEQLI